MIFNYVQQLVMTLQSASGTLSNLVDGVYTDANLTEDEKRGLQYEMELIEEITVRIRAYQK